MLEPLRSLERKTPVVLIPGLTGTRLVDRKTGEIVWGDGASLFVPRDGGYEVALPISGDVPAAVAGGPLWSLRVLGIYPVRVYGTIRRLMEANGYLTGDLDAPQAGETFFAFAYDWRLGNVETAQRLSAALERLRVARGEDVLHVDLVVQSNAARIARYFVKYGGAPLEHAESGDAPRPSDVVVDKLVLVGTANGGAIRVLKAMDRGRRYVRAVGRRFRAEVFFTFPSLYEALPGYLEHAIVDERGRPLDADLFAPESWERFGWSVFAPGTADRLRRAGRTDLFGDPDTRWEFLSSALVRARRLQDVMLRDAPAPAPTRFYLIESAYRPTPARAVVSTGAGRPHTWFAGDRRVDRDPILSAAATSPGDGHATIESQEALAPDERAAIAAPTTWIDDKHFEMILNPAAQRRILEILLEPDRTDDRRDP